LCPPRLRKVVAGQIVGMQFLRTCCRGAKPICVVVPELEDMSPLMSGNAGNGSPSIFGLQLLAHKCQAEYNRPPRTRHLCFARGIGVGPCSIAQESITRVDLEDPVHLPDLCDQGAIEVTVSAARGGVREGLSDGQTPST